MKQPDGRLGKIFNYYYLGLLFSQRLALPTVMESNICSAGKEFSTKIETEKTKAGRKWSPKKQTQRVILWLWLAPDRGDVVQKLYLILIAAVFLFSILFAVLIWRQTIKFEKKALAAKRAKEEYLKQLELEREEKKRVGLERMQQEKPAEEQDTSNNQ